MKLKTWHMLLLAIVVIAAVWYFFVRSSDAEFYGGIEGQPETQSFRGRFR